MVGFTKITKEPVILNKEGAPAYALQTKLDLVTRVTTSNREPKYYGYDEQELISLVHKVLVEDPIFILKLASYTRNVMYMRSIPVLLLVEYANIVPGTIPGARKWVPKIVRRADELAEVIACQLERNSRIPRKKKIPNFLVYGLRAAFPNFNAYQLAKYKGEGNNVKLRDAMFITHPKAPSQEVQEAYDKLAENRLVIEEGATWERIISQKGSTKEAWTEACQVMPYMALLRNLRNLVINGVSEGTLKRRCMDIADPSNVAKSKQLPFRFISAYNELEKINAPGYVLAAISDACDASIGNLPKMEGKLAIWADSSGSMTSCSISERSSISCADIAAQFAAALYKANPDALLGLFSDNAKLISLNPRDSIISNTKKLMSMFECGGTCAYKIFPAMGDHKVDAVILLSDMQCYSEFYTSYFGNSTPAFSKTFNDYCSRVNPKCRLISFDLDGYGSSQVSTRDSRVTLFSGWSDKALKLIAKSPEGILPDVEAVTLNTF